MAKSQDTVTRTPGKESVGLSSGPKAEVNNYSHLSKSLDFLCFIFHAYRMTVIYHPNQDTFESEQGSNNNYTRMTGLNLDCTR